MYFDIINEQKYGRISVIILLSYLDATDFSIGSMAQAIIATGIALVILALFGLIAVNMMLLTISGWILAYAGIFFLGFGGSRWTSDIAIAFYKNVLMVGTQLMVMILIVGIGQSFLTDLIHTMSAEVVLKELGVILLATISLYHLANKVPLMVASIVTGHINTGHVGQAGTGALIASAVTAAAVSNQATQAAIASAQSVAGGSMAIQAAMKSTNGDFQSSSMTSPISGNSSNANSNSSANGQSLSSAMGEMAGSIGGATQSTATNETLTINGDQTSNSTSKSNVNGANQQTGGESFGKAIIRGIGELAADKIAQTQQHIRENTFGGKLATAIENPGALAQQRTSMNTRHEPPDVKAEVAAFRDKNLKTG